MNNDWINTHQLLRIFCRSALLIHNIEVLQQNAATHDKTLQQRSFSHAAALPLATHTLASHLNTLQQRSLSLDAILNAPTPSCRLLPLPPTFHSHTRALKHTYTPSNVCSLTLANFHILTLSLLLLSVSLVHAFTFDLSLALVLFSYHLAYRMCNLNLSMPCLILDPNSITSCSMVRVKGACK